MQNPTQINLGFGGAGSSDVVSTLLRQLKSQSSPLLSGPTSCQDFGTGKNYCSQWCNGNGGGGLSFLFWGCEMATHGGYTCNCGGCNGCSGTRDLNSVWSKLTTDTVDAELFDLKLDGVRLKHTSGSWSLASLHLNRKQLLGMNSGFFS
jgi:hypothetical protein